MSPKSYRASELGEPAPQTLNRYRLLGLLAKGGMAEVFLACADGMGGFQRLLVIKRILPELASDTDFVRMFLDEARIAAKLHHGNIVQVFEVDMADGQVFYAMEHLHGQDVGTALRRLAARGARMPLGNAIAITAAVAAGLHYAHERCTSDGAPLHIVHRDVAPNNVIVTYDGNVKLIDFGIAKAANNLSRTRFGLFKGKLPYASPEQCRCEPIDRRTDVFSLGVMLYELTTGQQLFTADNEYDLLRVVSEAVVPRPRLRDKSYPKELEAIVLKALAHDPDERYESAHALQCDLEVFASKLQLDLSATSLARFMGTVFGSELLQWHSAERAGLTLEQHIITTTTSRRSIEYPAGDRGDRGDRGDPLPKASATERGGTQRRRSRLARHVLMVAAAAGLVGAGALGMLWWTSSPAVAPAARAAAPVPAVVPVEPAAPAAPDIAEPEAPVAPVAPAPMAPAPVVPAPMVPAPMVPAADPEPRAASSDDTVELEQAPAQHPAKKPRRPRARVPRAPAAVEPPADVAPVERPRPRLSPGPSPRLDEATLDEVAPRSTGPR